MDPTELILWMVETWGDQQAAAAIGLVTGLVFGVCAERSKFCLRSATIEFWSFKAGPKLGIWLLVFSTALIMVQFMMSNDMISSQSIRQLTNVGSLSGAMIGGSLFGIGMILARGCASRLLVLSGTGNLRALVAGMILTFVAQATLRGMLSPLREYFGNLWRITPDKRDMSLWLPDGLALSLGLVLLALAIVFSVRGRLSGGMIFFSLGVGFSVALGWYLTYTLSGLAFEGTPVTSVTFTGPSADTLMAIINQPEFPFSFSSGLVPGVFIGSFLSSTLSGDFEIQTFTDEVGLPRYIIGATLMGFGGMLAGGCAVGAGITGGAVMTFTAWVALLFMWFGAGLAHMVVETDLMSRKPSALHS